MFIHFIQKISRKNLNVTNGIRWIDTLIKLVATCIFCLPWSMQLIIGVETGCNLAGLVEYFEEYQTKKTEKGAL